MNNTLLEIKDLYVNAEEKKILKGLNLKINKGEVHVVMGPNGAGKSTLANAIFNNPVYTKENGQVLFEDEDITNSKTDEIARKGVFMSFQLPEEIPGVSVTNFLKYAKNKMTGKPVKVFAFKEEIKGYMEQLHINPSYMDRNLNVGFSGGEKKKNEILQLKVLEPKFIILDELDSGLDVDSLKIVGQNVMDYYKQNSPALLVITHYQRLLDYIIPTHVHIMKNGTIIKSGDSSLVDYIEKNGYDNIEENQINSTCIIKENSENE